MRYIFFRTDISSNTGNLVTIVVVYGLGDEPKKKYMRGFALMSHPLLLFGFVYIFMDPSPPTPTS